MAESIISNVLNKAVDGAYDFVNVLPWGNYAREGQTATLTRDITKAKIIKIRSGWSSPANTAGQHDDIMIAPALKNTYCAFYLVGGNLQYVLFEFTNATTITILKSSNTDLGIREIYAVF